MEIGQFVRMQGRMARKRPVGQEARKDGKKKARNGPVGQKAKKDD